jgi:uncharacterized protein YdhG (YjbR/CyaY superfamily)
METRKRFCSVAEYLEAQPSVVQSALLELKACILSVIPEAEEVINYNIPAYALVKGGNREQQIMIAGYEKHVGLYPHPLTIQYFENELKGYKTGKGSVQFPLNQPLPKELIIRMVEYRWRMIK